MRFKAHKMWGIVAALTGFGFSWPRWTPKTQKHVSWEQKHAKRPEKAIKDMKLPEEAIMAASYYESINNHELQLAAYQRVIAIAKDPEVIAQYLLKIADYHLEAGSHSDAIKEYQRLITLYPGSGLVEPARYREIMAQFMSALNHRRDQTATKAVITLGKKYLKDYTAHEPQKCLRIAGMIAAAYATLVEHELAIAEFYLNKHTLERTLPPLKAAIKRVQHVQNELLGEIDRYVTTPSRLPAPPLWPLELDRILEESSSILQENYNLLVQHIHQIRLSITALVPPPPPRDARDRF